MNVNRVEAFSDGVIAVIITIMVLEFKVPADASLASLLKLVPLFLTYLLTYATVAVMWMNHHHLLKTAKRAGAALMWANSNLLFWMSLAPFVTAYMADHHDSPLAVSLYGLAMAPMGFGFMLLRMAVAAQQKEVAELVEFHRRIQWKNLGSAMLYFVGAGMAYVDVRVSFVIYVLIVAGYFLPERTLERFAEGALE